MACANHELIFDSCAAGSGYNETIGTNGVLQSNEKAML